MEYSIDARTTVWLAASGPMLRDCTEIRQCILGQQQILIAAARDLQRDYESRRDKSGFRWQELILAIKTPRTLLIEWSRRRRIRKTPGGRRWWWSRMPYDADRKEFRFRHLLHGLSSDDANLVIEIETRARELRQRWAETTRLLISLCALERACAQMHEPWPWADAGRLPRPSLPEPSTDWAHPDIDVNTFGGSLGLTAHGLRGRLLRDVRTLCDWVDQARSSPRICLGVTLRGNALRVEWRVPGAPMKRLPVSVRLETATRLLMRHVPQADQSLVSRAEMWARLVRAAWARLNVVLRLIRALQRSANRNDP